MLSIIVFTACSKDDEPANQAPESFTVTPTVIDNTATLNWTAAIDPEGGTVTYDVFLDGQATASELTTTTYEFTGLDYSKTFTGKVIASDEEGLTSEAIYNFNTGLRPNTAPTAATLSTPSAGAHSVILEPELTWQAATDAENDAIVYDVYLDESNNPTTKIAENLTATSFKVTSKLSNNTQYFWKVIARDSFDAETESTSSTFVTKDLVKAKLAADEPGFEERDGHTSVVFQDKMWVIGGNRLGNRYNDIWSSTDGENWVEEIASAPFEARTAHASVVYDGKVWVTGGNKNYSGHEFNDVWFSEDGKNWKLATSDAAFGKRYSHKMVVYKGKMWVIGGRDQKNYYKDVWSSTDGVTWTKVSDDLGMNPFMSEFIVFKDKVWRIGGYTDPSLYSTTDGDTWTLEGENMPYGVRFNHKITVWDNKIWLISGSDRATDEYNELPDVWYTEDGKNWKLASKSAGYGKLAQHTVVTYKDKIWIIAGGGGYRDTYLTNDVWYLVN